MLEILLGALLLPAPPNASPATIAHPRRELARLDAKELYAEHCAQCHGANGDGQGTTDLDRPARSFLDGGYSYGNTRKAVLRSISYGIPGTPMPAFAETLDEDARKALADFVIGLGPEGTIVEPGSSQLRMGDQPRIVHGMMPAIPGGPARQPRSLVVGFPNGTTLRYAKARGELEAMYVGEFLDRADWGGRGGSSLKPQGTLVWKRTDAFQDADLCSDDAGSPLTKSIRSARVAGDGVRLDFKLRDAEGTPVGGGQEFLSFLDVEGVPVGMRTLVATGRAERAVIFRAIDGDPVATIAGEEGGPALAEVRSAGDGVLILTFPGAPAVRTLINANSWSDSLASAVRTSLNAEGR